MAKEELKRFNPSIESGLEAFQVQYMQDNGYTNKNKNPTNKSYFAIIFGNIFAPFNILMFAIAAFLVIVVGDRVLTNLMFLGIIICNILIGTIQECKSKHTIEKLKLMSNDKTTVRRAGKQFGIFAHEVVLDDIVVLSPGDQIPVDCVILVDDVVEVNEALLTGESLPVKKSKGDVLFAGSFIVSGVAIARADKVGNDTYISSIENKAKLAKRPKSRLMIAINKTINMMAILAIPLALVVFINEFLRFVLEGRYPDIIPQYWGADSAITNAVFFSGTTITYMIPCGMALLASVAMATGVVKLAQNKTLAQDLYSVESLSRVNTLCLDKTGTLTDGTMVMEDYKILDESITDDEITTIMSSYLTAFKSANQTSTALINKFGALIDRGDINPQTQTSYALLGQFREHPQLKVIDTIEFSSARKFSGVEFEELGWFVMGAPEFLTDDKVVLDRVSELAKDGLRVLLLAKVEGKYTNKELPPENKKNIAMFIIRDNIRPEVKDTMYWFRNNDVDIKVISGDNVGTVSYIAKQCGIENWDKTFDMSTLKPEDDFESIVLNNAIFGRVTPDQKADIIACLKKNQRIVAVTGDGLNDLLAFKQADCSIALANGAAATKNVANLVLLDSNFANMKEAVFQGRRVVNNIQRSSSLFVMKDFLWFFITVLPILLGVPHMAQPTVMTVVNIFITGIAALFVSLEPDKTRVKGNFFRNVVEKAITSGFYMFIPVLLITLYVIITQLVKTGNLDNFEVVMKEGFGPEGVSFGWLTTMAICISIGGFVIFFNNCRPFTKYRKWLYALTLVVVIVALYLAPEFYIVSGVEMLEYAGGILKVPHYIITHFLPNIKLALYRTMTLEQIIFIGAYLVISIPLYKFNNKYFTKLVEKLLFSKREYLDE